MSIGLYDADMAKYTHVPFNLEIMKLASFYTKKREIVTLSPTFDPEKYTKFIYRKDYYDGEFNPQLLKHNNIEYGGLAFSDNNYIALPLEIEQQKPITSIYSKYQKEFSTMRHYEKFFGKMVDGAHFRLSLDGSNIWDNYETQINNENNNHVLFIHDPNIAQLPDADLAITNTLKSLKTIGLPRAIAFKFPICLENEYDLFKWLKFLPALSSYTIQYRGVMSDECVAELAKTHLSDSLTKQIEYIVAPASYDENHFLKYDLPKIFKQVIFLQMNKQKIILKSEDYFFSDERWEKLLQFFNAYLSWARGQKNYESASLAFFASLLRDQKLSANSFSISEARELFRFVGENNYELFKQFYECSRVELIGGEFQ